MRKTIQIEIKEAGSRDNGKMFQITEMPALQGESWAFRALQLLGKSGLDLTDEIGEFSALRIAQVGLTSLSMCNYEEVAPLLSEILQQVQIKMPTGGWRSVITDDFEEISTLFKIRKEFFSLQYGFLSAFGSRKPI